MAKNFYKVRYGKINEYLPYMAQAYGHGDTRLVSARVNKDKTWALMEFDPDNLPPNFQGLLIEKGTPRVEAVAGVEPTGLYAELEALEWRGE